MGDPQSSDDGNPIDDDELELLAHELGKQNALALAAAQMVASHAESFIFRQQCHTSKQTGWKWMMEILNGHPQRCHQMFRMQKDVFIQLCSILHNQYDLQPTRETRVEEMVGIFLVTVGLGWGNRETQERFQHSGSAIHKFFHRVLAATTRMSLDWIKPRERSRVHNYIRRNKKYWPYFKDCIGAIDGTHIKAAIPLGQQIPYIRRKGYPTQNIMATCDFDMCFTFVLPGWEGSAHDTRIFYSAVRDASKNFPMPQGDQFYLVDAGYPNIKGFLAPYKGERYHLPDFQRAQPQNASEVFNYIHSSLRSVIERSFGVWKARWKLLRIGIPHNYSFPTQVALVASTMAIHNFIRRESVNDLEFEVYDRDPEYIPVDNEPYVTNGPCHGPQIQGDDNEMNDIRNRICQQICEQYH